MIDGERIGQGIEKAVLVTLVVAFAIICIGTVSIPVVLAIIYTWKWLLAYPALLILLLILAPRKK